MKLVSTALLDLVEPALTAWSTGATTGPSVPGTRRQPPVAATGPLTAATGPGRRDWSGRHNAVADLAPAAVRVAAAHTPRSRAGGPRGRGDKADGYRAKTPS